MLLVAPGSGTCRQEGSATEDSSDIFMFLNYLETRCVRIEVSCDADQNGLWSRSETKSSFS